VNGCCPLPPSGPRASGTISFRQANSSHGSSSIKRGARDLNQDPCAVPSLHAALHKGALNRLTSQGVTPSHSSRMDPVILLFRLVAKITTSEGAISRPYLHLNPAQGANVSVQRLSLGKKSLTDRPRFEDLARLPSMASSTPSLSWRSSSVRSWGCTLPSHWRMLFDTTRSYGIPQTTVFAPNLPDANTTPAISVTMSYNPKDS